MSCCACLRIAHYIPIIDVDETSITLIEIGLRFRNTDIILSVVIVDMKGMFFHIRITKRKMSTQR